MGRWNDTITSFEENDFCSIISMPALCARQLEDQRHNSEKKYVRDASRACDSTALSVGR